MAHFPGWSRIRREVYCKSLFDGGIGNSHRKRLLPRPRNLMVVFLKEGKRPTGLGWSTTSETKSSNLDWTWLFVGSQSQSSPSLSTARVTTSNNSL